MLAENEIRVELRCGKNEAIDEAEAMYGRAKKIAVKFGICTYFDRAFDHGDEFCDGYVYPTTENIIQVLDELDAASVEYDNIDVQPKHLTLPCVQVLRERFPSRCGVCLNLGAT